MWKNTSKITRFARWENTTVRVKKIASNFAATRKTFSKTRIGFRHWVTGIIKPNDWNILRHDLHNNRWFDKIRKIYPMQNNHDSRKTNKVFLKKIINHGIFEYIIKNKNKLFTSKFNKKLRKIWGWKKKHVNSFSFLNKRWNRPQEPNMKIIF